MVHQYKNNGYDIVLDVNSGAIHVVDDVTYDVIEMIDQSQPESYARDEIVSALSGKYGKEEVEEAIDEVQTLIDEESLFTKDTYENYIMDFKKRPTVVKALCLHIAPVSYTHLRAHETDSYLVCRLLLEKKKKKKTQISPLPPSQTTQKKIKKT